MPSHDHTVELKDLRLQRLQLRAKSGNTRACNLGQSSITGIADDTEQLFDPIAADRGNDPKLGKMRADRVDHRSLLTDQDR